MRLRIMTQSPVPNQRMASPRQLRGVGMIEVLVAIVILTFGMLGLAGLQSRILSFNQSSLYRSQATALTDDILDRMRADRANARAERWDTLITAASSSISGPAIFQSDLREWKEEVERLLPAGAASIDLDPTNNIVTVTIQWDDSRGREAAERFVTQSGL